MKKKVLWASMLVAAPMLAQAGDRVAVDSVGYDVASNAIVISGSNFVGAAQAAPEVRVGPVAARVTSYVDGFIVVEAPAGLPAGEHAVVVTPAGGRHAGRMSFALAVTVPHVIERGSVLVRR